MCGADIFLGLLAVLFPPLAVWVKRGICSADSCINIALCILGYIPGLIHAWYIIAKYPEPDYDLVPQHNTEGGHGRGYGRGTHGATVTYYYVQAQPAPRPNGGHQGYGTTATNEPPAAHHHVDVANGRNPRVIADAPANGEGSAGGVLPSYAEAVKGDHKVQSQE